MSTKKDLVEAHAFSRRRLVTAFVSGAPGGREVEPSRPGRTIVGGVALGVLVLAGGAIAGVFSSRAPEGWLEPGLVASGGTLYAITEQSDDPELRPIDPVSGTLVFGSDVEPAEVSAEDVAQQRSGAQIGILGAPSALPSPSMLINDGWTACTAEGSGIRVDVADPPAASPAVGSALVVRAGGSRWLIASGELSDDPDDQAFRFELPGDAGAAAQVLDALELPSVSTQIPQVDEAWLNLWEPGSPLEEGSFDVGDGSPVEGSEGWFEGLEQPLAAGTVVESNGTPYLVTPDGPAPLSDFAATVYGAVAVGAPEEESQRLSANSTTGSPDEWPDAVPEAVGDGSLCAMLVPRDGESPTVLVADAPEDPEAAEQVAPGEAEAVVQEGRGAFVVSGAPELDQGPSPYVIDARGVAYQVEGQDAVDALGYGGDEPRVVPDAWLNLFGCGVTLSRNAALSPPDPTTTPRC